MGRRFFGCDEPEGGGAFEFVDLSVDGSAEDGFDSDTDDLYEPGSLVSADFTAAANGRFVSSVSARIDDTAIDMEIPTG